MKAVILGCMMLFASSALADEYYEKSTVIAAQEALVRLGYDVGEIDGLWGSKTRTALNQLRLQSGLPSAEDFTGSSLALIHRLSPGETTLPNPGILITDPVERRAFLELPENRSNSYSWCPGKVDEVPTLAELLKLEPIAVVTAKTGLKYYISREDD
jgi:peptidoglycan hydrolase-like protein with peptidoglycan-binding domain